MDGKVIMLLLRAVPYHLCMSRLKALTVVMHAWVVERKSLNIFCGRMHGVVPSVGDATDSSVADALFKGKHLSIFFVTRTLKSKTKKKKDHA